MWSTIWTTIYYFTFAEKNYFLSELLLHHCQKLVACIDVNLFLDSQVWSTDLSVWKLILNILITVALQYHF